MKIDIDYIQTKFEQQSKSFNRLALGESEREREEVVKNDKEFKIYNTALRDFWGISKADKMFL